MPRTPIDARYGSRRKRAHQAGCKVPISTPPITALEVLQRESAELSALEYLLSLSVYCSERDEDIQYRLHLPRALSLAWLVCGIKQ